MSQMSLMSPLERCHLHYCKTYVITTCKYFLWICITVVLLLILSLLSLLRLIISLVSHPSLLSFVSLLLLLTQFEIECRSGEHSVTKKFLTVFQIFTVKFKWPKKENIYWQDICNEDINFSSLKNALRRTQKRSIGGNIHL